MPESKVRRKRAYTAPSEKSAAPKPNPAWFVPLMLGLMVFGLIWIVVFYTTAAQYPVPQLGQGNLVVGFAFILVGFAMTTKWR